MREKARVARREEETRRREGREKIRILAFYLRADLLASNKYSGDVHIPRGGVPEMRAGSTSKKKKVGGGGELREAPEPTTSFVL